MRSFSGLRAMALTVVILGGCSSPMSWENELEQRLPACGHRNWIVVADAAYPRQNAPGIETVATGGELLDMLDKTLESIDGAPHVRAVVLLDAELEHVSEEDAPGVEVFRQQLEERLEGRPVRRTAHEEIIGELDEAARVFDILLLKTDLTIPYTSIFLQLECGYWGEEQEARLRRTIAKLG